MNATEITVIGSITDTQFVDSTTTTTDSLTVAPGGSIETTGILAHGVYSDGSGNTVTNQGHISTNGISANGIHSLGSHAQIRNSGTIYTQDENSSGIRSTGETAVLSNSGTIWTRANSSYGIYTSGLGSTLNNGGSIRTDGTDAFGIWNSGDGTKIINEGRIQTYGYGSTGIFNDANDSMISNLGAIRTEANDTYGIANQGNSTFVSNAGLIETSGDVAAAIVNFGSGANIVNTGMIRTTGSLSTGILSIGEDTKITHAGAIISEQGHAIYTDVGGGTVVNLNAPGYLGGEIFFGTSTELNIRTGASHSVLWQLPTANIEGGQANVSGSVPWFYNTSTGQIATFDPTGFSATINQLAETSNTLARLGRNGLKQTDRGARADASATGLLAYGEDALRSSMNMETLLEPDFGIRTGRVWIVGFGGTADYDGNDTTLDQRIEQVGSAVGFAWKQSPGMRIGVMAGYMYGHVTAGSLWAQSQDIDSNGVFTGIHGDWRFGTVTAGLGLAGGWQSYDSSRFVNDNMALTGGLTLGHSNASASYDSWFVTPEATLSADLDLGSTGLVLTPGLHGRYALQRIGSYSETGSKANATVAAHTFGIAEGDIELALSRRFQLAELTARAGYLIRNSTGDNGVPVTLLGITNSIDPGKTDHSITYLGAALDLYLGPEVSFKIDTQAYFSGNSNTIQSMARLQAAF